MVGQRRREVLDLIKEAEPHEVVEAVIKLLDDLEIAFADIAEKLGNMTIETLDLAYEAKCDAEKWSRELY